jgi:Gluconate 2-dehydrogenase subunit 3
MKRRDVITLLGFLSLGNVGVLWRVMASAWRPAPYEHIASTVAAVADLMFPGDGLPGATELGLHTRILAMPDLQALLAQGVVSIDKRAAAQGVSDFLALDEAGRLAAVDAAFASNEDGTQSFLLVLRFHLGTAYYSEPLIKAAFPYTGPPQPNGFVDFEDRPA